MYVLLTFPIKPYGEHSATSWLFHNIVHLHEMSFCLVWSCIVEHFLLAQCKMVNVTYFSHMPYIYPLYLLACESMSNKIVTMVAYVLACCRYMYFGLGLNKYSENL